MAHILPHWNWRGREGEITPVHVFTSGDEAELFLNGRSQGRKKKAEYEYRLRWDEVMYEPGELRVVAYKNGVTWAEEVVKTTGEPNRLVATADCNEVMANGQALIFVTVSVNDKEGLTVPTADNRIQFEVEGPGEIVATDNGDPTNMEPFPSHSRAAFNGKALVIIRPVSGREGTIELSTKSPGLEAAQVVIKSE